MKCQAVCLALGYDGKEATIPNFKELMDGEAMSFNPQSHHKTEQTYGQIDLHICFSWQLSCFKFKVLSDTQGIMSKTTEIAKPK